MRTLWKEAEITLKPSPEARPLDKPSSTIPIEFYRLVIHPRKLAQVLTVVVIGLVLCHLATNSIAYTMGHDTQFGLRHQFHLDNENNLPTWYQSITLLTCAVLLAIIGLHNRHAEASGARYWQSMAAIFLYLATDEAASIHEMTMLRFDPFLKPYDYFHGYLLYSWVILGVIGVLWFVTAYRQFVATLPTKTRHLFLLAGALYVGGGLGFELAGSRHDFLYGRENFTYATLVACEEGLEMLGVVVFIYALTSYLGSLRAGLQILVSEVAFKNNSQAS